jgi:tRNA threonylcarbamoyl adenosine modification protein (Sua5/YciO/YrdC/YwlC family)
MRFHSALTLFLWVGALLAVLAFRPRQSAGRVGRRSGQLFASGKVGKGGKKKGPLVVVIDDYHADAWKLNEVVAMLQAGKCGVIPTDTCYSFVTPISSRSGVEQLLQCKKSGRKPLSFLCRDISQISTYVGDLMQEKWVFQMLKGLLPGPFTFVLPSSKAVPSFVVGQHPGHRGKLIKWKRREIGVRIPNDPITLLLMKDMDVPLLMGSIPEAGEDYVEIALRAKVIADEEEGEDGGIGAGDVFDDEDNGSDDEADYHNVQYFESMFELPWATKVDFIVIGGERGGGSAEKLSTIVDLTAGEPQVIRQGKGLLGSFSTKV